MVLLFHKRVRGGHLTASSYLCIGRRCWCKKCDLAVRILFDKWTAEIPCFRQCWQSRAHCVLFYSVNIKIQIIKLNCLYNFHPETRSGQWTRFLYQKLLMENFRFYSDVVLKKCLIILLFLDGWFPGSIVDKFYWFFYWFIGLTFLSAEFRDTMSKI